MSAFRGLDWDKWIVDQYLIRVFIVSGIQTSFFIFRLPLIRGKLKSSSACKSVITHTQPKLLINSAISIKSSSKVVQCLSRLLHLFTISQGKWSLPYWIWKFFIERNRVLLIKGVEKVSKVSVTNVNTCHTARELIECSRERVCDGFFFVNVIFFGRKRSSPQPQSAPVWLDGYCLWYRSWSQRVHELYELLQWVRNVSFNNCRAVVHANLNIYMTLWCRCGYRIVSRFLWTWIISISGLQMK